MMAIPVLKMIWRKWRLAITLLFVSPVRVCQWSLVLPLPCSLVMMAIHVLKMIWKKWKLVIILSFVSPCAGTPVVACATTTMLPCDDGDPCTENDMEEVEACDNSIVCVPCAGTPVVACATTTMLPCDDGDPCTENDMEEVEACDNSIVCVPLCGYTGSRLCYHYHAPL